MRKGAEAKQIGFKFVREGGAIRPHFGIADFRRGGFESRFIDVADADNLKSRIRMKRGGVVNPAFPHPYDYYTVLVHGPLRSAVAFVPLETLANNIIDFLLVEFRKHWKRNTGGGILFGIRNRTGDSCAFSPRVTRLLMDGDGIMGLGVDAVVVEKLQQSIALLRLFGFDHVEMEDMPIARSLGRKCEVLRSLEPGGITRRPFSAEIVPSIDVF